MNWISSGRFRRLAVVRADGGVWIGWPGGSRFFSRESSSPASAGTASEDVRAPMTGRVVRIGVQSGAAVRQGDIVAVLEAMKMEYRLAAPHDGVVERVACAEGGQVELGAVMLTVRKA